MDGSVSPMNPSPRRNLFREAVHLGWGGAKENILPGLALWVVGLALVICYYRFEPVAQSFDLIGDLKDRTSPWFAMISTAIFGSLVPWLVGALFLPKEKRLPIRRVPLLFLFWAIHGWQVDKLYELQSVVFGSELKTSTIFFKTVVDQFLWSPFLATPQVLLFYLFSEQDHSARRFKLALQRKSFLQRLIPLLLTNWVVWIPSVALIYLFPLPLQLPLMNLILAIWCLIISFFAKNA
ncbi:hypothetical protein GCM10007100_22900 [Roseibacillus persicicus]|uniref:Uncharacterized protein n=2 Tax=Roseibacillus persicicus TaxID=454148 RepID=A0A918TNH6_9BACT|nr:hypothetical protein GCM10007100_22900 [Roseibacillus persicicus]